MLSIVPPLFVSDNHFTHTEEPRKDRLRAQAQRWLSHRLDSQKPVGATSSSNKHSSRWRFTRKNPTHTQRSFKRDRHFLRAVINMQNSAIRLGNAAGDGDTTKNWKLYEKQRWPNKKWRRRQKQRERAFPSSAGSRRVLGAWRHLREKVRRM